MTYQGMRAWGQSQLKSSLFSHVLHVTWLAFVLHTICDCLRPTNQEWGFRYVSMQIGDPAHKTLAEVCVIFPHWDLHVRGWNTAENGDDVRGREGCEGNWRWMRNKNRGEMKSICWERGKEAGRPRLPWVPYYVKSKESGVLTGGRRGRQA